MYFCHMRILTGKFLKLHVSYQVPFYRIKKSTENFQPSSWHLPLSIFDFPARQLASALFEEWRNSDTTGHIRPNFNFSEDTRSTIFLRHSFLGFAPQHHLQCHSACSAVSVEVRVSRSLAEEQQAMKIPWLPQLQPPRDKNSHTMH